VLAAVTRRFVRHHLMHNSHKGIDKEKAKQVRIVRNKCSAML
jgi:hypothetical protein